MPCFTYHLPPTTLSYHCPPLQLTFLPISPIIVRITIDIFTHLSFHHCTQNYLTFLRGYTGKLPETAKVDRIMKVIVELLESLPSRVREQVGGNGQAYPSYIHTPLSHLS